MEINANISSPILTKLDISWSDLVQPENIARLDADFVQYLQQHDAALASRFHKFRNQNDLPAKDHSLLLIEVSIYLENYIAELLNIESAVVQAQDKAKALLPLFSFKKEIIQKGLKKRKKEATDLATQFNELDHQLEDLISQYAIDTKLTLETQLAILADQLLKDPTKYQAELDLITKWCVAATHHPQAQILIKDWLSFKSAKKLDFNTLIECEPFEFHDTTAYKMGDEQLRQRDGFSLTDEGLGDTPIMDEAQYCVYCHQSGTDYCSKGFLLKKSNPDLGYKKDPHGALLLGCPLEEKISEMNWLYHIGQIIAPLAMIMLDNPMCPATGYRICNDCMKACIYQKQKPVDIPAVETDSLKRVLALPWGVEIYWLLTLWSPLSHQPLPTAFHNTKTLVMGMGPAGFTLSHYLLRAGYAVVGMDGLKLSPINKQALLKPIESYASLIEDLDERRVLGFGGVAEYGITSRWDKNYLSLIYLTLIRQPYFQCFGSVRFGGTMTIDRAWELGFDHLAIAVGAGLPKELPIENSMVNGMRQANDFLMALQLTGASKKDSLANLQIRLPAVVIGGGLTGVDAATELQAYYIRQIEKTAERYQILISQLGEQAVRQSFDPVNLAILDEQLNHAKQLQEERALAKADNRHADIVKLIRQWGGVSIVYRKAMQQSPAYRLNHEELDKAMQEGLYYVPYCEPSKVICDAHKHAKALQCFNHETQKDVVIPAKTILVATGAKPNVAYSFEHRGQLEKDGLQYKRYQNIHDQLTNIDVDNHCKEKQLGMFTSYQNYQKRVSFLGDTHPTFHGSVVKAIASAKQAFLQIDALFDDKSQQNPQSYQAFAASMTKQFNNYLVACNELSEDIVELIVHAPEARKHYQPGVIYKLQTYNTAVSKNDLNHQASESVALGASITDQPDQLKFIMQKAGVSTSQIAHIKPGEPLVVMGPTGVRATIVENQSIVIIGGLLALTQLESLLPDLLANKNEVYFFGCFKDKTDYVAINDVLDKCTAYDLSMTEDWQVHSQALKHFLTKHVPQMKQPIEMRIVGYDKLLQWIKTQRLYWIDQLVPSDTSWIGSVYGPMQCMLKGVCAQCLQWQIDPTTGKRTKAVYACSWQDQPFDKIDIVNIEERLSQNHMQEQLTQLYYQVKIND